MSRTVSRLPRIPDTIAGLIDSRLSGAKCSGHAPLFDDELPNETSEHRSQRLAWAAHQCRACPVQSACRTAAAEVTDPAGLWARPIHGQPGRPRLEEKT
ncbi:WhiB family transcriptional regulator [Rhodococcus sp. 7Tela_A2]|uniref:WhiB family transcriptional regulator n=1 Tax=Rhodococcus sp. 7Tela_A2 TaxID=3093744 RepID=UPI003BB7DDFB